MNNQIKSVPPLWLLFLLIGFPQLSETIYSPALPNIANALATSNDWVQWTLSIYFIGFAVGVFLWGRYSDTVGRRPAMLFGIGAYIIGGIICLLSENIAVLLFARLIQGFGASAGSVLTQTIVRESLDGKQRHQFFSAAGFTFALSIALGPFVGGFLTQWFGWRANFSLLVVIGIVLIIFSKKYLPETRNSTVTEKKKIFEVMIMLLKDKYFLGCTWLVAAVIGMLYSYYAEAPFVFIRIVHLTESQYGWLGAGIALAAFLGSVASKKLTPDLSVSKLFALGCITMLISSILLLLSAYSGLITSTHPIWAVTLVMLPMMGIVFGSYGFVIPLTFGTALQNYQSVLGTAAALFGLFYYIVISILTWTMGFIHNGTVYPMPIYFVILSIISLLVFVFLIQKKQSDDCVS